MSTEIPPTDPTEPVLPVPKDGPAKPDNQYNDSAPEGLLDTPAVAKPVAKPNNQYNDSAPKG